MRRFTVLLALALAVGCDGDPDAFDVRVELRTDYVLGAEFASVSLSLAPLDDPFDVREVPGALSDGVDLIAGTEIATIDGVTAGEWGLTTTLRDAGGLEVASRLTIFEIVDASATARVVMTRDCPPARRCGDGMACVSAECVDARCAGADTAEACGAITCAADTDCPSSPVECARNTCSDGICLTMGVAGACPAGEYCDTELGCVPPVEPEPDAGMPRDAGPPPSPDAGTDGGSPTDAGAPMDGGSPMDGGPPPMDAGTDAGPPPPTCNEIYGSLPNYELCEEAPTQCSFYVRPSFRRTCRTICGARGGGCIDGFPEDVSGTGCPTGGASFGCDYTQSDAVCVCTR